MGLLREGRGGGGGGGKNRDIIEVVNLEHRKLEVTWALLTFAFWPCVE